MSKSKSRIFADLMGSDGNMSLTGTVDGRDIAADGTKLDGVEVGATNYSLPSTLPASMLTGALPAISGAALTGLVADPTMGGDLSGVASNAQLVANSVTDTELNSAKLNAIESGATADQDLSSYATLAYVGTAVSNLVDSSPATMNTLNELAAALGDDPNFATTIAGNIGGKVDNGRVLTDVPAGAVFTDTLLADNSVNSIHYVDYSVDGVHLNRDRRSPSTGHDVHSGNTHDFTFYDASHGIRWYTSGAEEMRLENDGDLHVDGNIIAYSTTVSDERLKTDIVKIDGALDKVGQLNGYTFTYINDGKQSAGVVAQEVQKVLPSAITESKLPLKMGNDDETEYMTVQYDQLIGLLIEAVKELKAEVAELKEE